MIKRPKPKRFNGQIRFNVVNQITVYNEMNKSRMNGHSFKKHVTDSITFTKDKDVVVNWNSAWDFYQVYLAECVSNNGLIDEWIWLSRTTMRRIFSEGGIKIISSK